jgi:prepilin-type N-terminal cleavage/methylation domain-containing protein
MVRMNKAFTLVELLIVIAIIAVIAALLFPVLAQAKKTAKGSVEVSNMRQLYMALTMYEEDFSEQDPRILTDVESYARNRDIFTSPLDVYRMTMPNGMWTAKPFSNCSVDPADASSYKISYGYLKVFDPYDRDEEAWKEIRSSPSVGIIASPWLGSPAEWSKGLGYCGMPIEVFTGPIMEGPIQRICMDGSLYRLGAHSEHGAFGAAIKDLFFSPSRLPGH